MFVICLLRTVGKVVCWSSLGNKRGFGLFFTVLCNHLAIRQLSCYIFFLLLPSLQHIAILLANLQTQLPHGLLNIFSRENSVNFEAKSGNHCALIYIFCFGHCSFMLSILAILVIFYIFYIIFDTIFVLSVLLQYVFANFQHFLDKEYCSIFLEYCSAVSLCFYQNYSQGRSKKLSNLTDSKRCAAWF